jgi:hypothetical protein
VASAGGLAKAVNAVISKPLHPGRMRLQAPLGVGLRRWWGFQRALMLSACTRHLSFDMGVHGIALVEAHIPAANANS